MNKRVVVDPDHPHRGPPAHRGRDRRGRRDHGGLLSSGTMVRGIEIILRGRDPRDAWAFAQRICGVCTLVHGIASVRAVEDALKSTIPTNAQLIRNLMIGAQYVHDHVMHFYHLHALDWVDVVSALKADPKATSTLAQIDLELRRSPRPAISPTCRRSCKTFVDSGQLGIFANGYWGHPAYKLPPEANLMAVAHYLDALAWQRDVVQAARHLRRQEPASELRGRRRAERRSAASPSCRAAPRRRRSTSSAVAGAATSSSRCATSSTRSTCPTRWPSPASTRTGSRRAKASATS